MNLKKLTDEELAAQVQQGSKEALGELVRRYQSKLYGYARKLLDNHDDALDVIQDSFLKAYQNIQSFSVERKFSSWMYRIVHNEAINFINKRKKSVALEPDGLEWLLSQRKEFDEIKISFENEEDKARIKKAFTELRPKFKSVLVLYYFEDKSYEEISDILHVPKATVGVWASRAKKQLRKVLDKNDAKK
ncbi:RNA polymerase sigma factor [Patescibacteria group bacterium]|nr:RNA polymerase sigma factor [Patescibacteria group bacterium]